MRAQTARATQQKVAQPLSRHAFLMGLGAGATLLLAACEQQEQSADSSPRGPISAPTQVPAARAVVHPPRGDESSKPTPQELARAERWFAEAFQSPKRILPLAFRYGERDSTAFLAGWRAEWIQDATVAGVTHARITLTAPATSLQCQCAITTFADFPAVEWVVSFTNTGAVDSPILADIQPLDAIFPAARGQQCLLHTAQGAQAKLDDFAPQTAALEPRSEQRFAPADGRTSSEMLPFFNLDLGDTGVIGAVALQTRGLAKD